MWLPVRTVQDLTQRLRAEYLEMPGLWLTAEQVRRLCGIEQLICDLVLQDLVDAKFLCVKPSGHYARLTEGHLAVPNPVEVDRRTLVLERTKCFG